jgi:hypothetical protein
MSDINPQKELVVSNAEPEPRGGSGWIDPDTGVFQIAFDQGQGSGVDWVPVPPVAVTEEAGTFAESDVTVANNKTTVSNGAIELGQTLRPYVVSGASFVQSLDVSSLGGNIRAVATNNDGTRLYAIDTQDETLGQFDLSTAFDISTASNLQTKSLSGNTGGFLRGLVWNDTGSQFYVVGNSNTTIYQYTCSTDFDITGASFDSSAGIGSEDGDPTGAWWRDDDGSNFYLVGKGGDSVYQYDAPTAFDIGSISFTQSFDVSAQTTGPLDLIFNDTGDEMHVVDGSTVYKYLLSTAWDISTASFDSSATLSGTVAGGVSWGDGGTKIYFNEDGGSAIDEYNSGEGDALSGDAVIQFDSGVPADIEAYDLAAFQSSDDGETVTVDVEDGSGTVLYSDITQNFDITTVDPSKNVKLRANLSRSNTANNPTVDYAARRYTR